MRSVDRRHPGRAADPEPRDDRPMAGRARVAWLVGNLLPLELSSGPATRMLQRIHFVRLIVAGCFLGLVWLLPVPLSKRVTLFAMVGVAYLLWASLLLRWEAQTAPHMVVAIALGDLVVLFGVQLGGRHVRLVAMFGYLALVLFHAQLSGRNFGLVMAGAAMASVLAWQVLSPDGELGWFVVGMFGAIAVAVALVADILTTAHREAALRLQVLYSSLEQVTSSPDLPAVLSAVSSEAAAALEAAGCVVLLREGDDLVHYGSSDPDVNTFFAPLRRNAFAVPEGKELPAIRAVTTGKLVAIEDARQYDGPSWRAAAREMGVGAALCAPVRGPTSIEGALIVWFDRPRRFDAHERDLLVAYAGQAAITLDRAQAFERERTAAEKLRELDQLKSDLLSNVSHELRTPLTAITGFVDTLVEHGEALPPETRRALLGRASNAADQLTTRIDQLLDFARVESGRVRLKPTLWELGPWVVDVVERLERTLRQHRIDLAVEPGLRVWADANATSRVLENFLTNAAKFSPPGTRIRIIAHRADDFAELLVVDEGVGVAREEQDRVFERFYRSSRGDCVPSGGTGTGIGLAIAKQYAESQGGRVWVTSEAGRGSTFGVTVPLAGPRASVHPERSAS